MKNITLIRIVMPKHNIMAVEKKPAKFWNTTFAEHLFIGAN